jgi:two-component system, cell cycle response regulator
MTDIFEQVKEKLSLFEGMYDVVRIVSPVDKKNITLTDCEKSTMNGTCYEYWKKNTFCSNCISMRAYSERDTFTKIEYCDNKVILTTATPLNIDNTTYIVEILKDISKDGRVFDYKANHEVSVSDVISELNNAAIMDELTGIYNRRYINERLPVDINNSIIDGSSLSLIMVDIDHLKEINDKYGHTIGDKIIRELAQLICVSIRKNTDWVGRFEGDKLLVVLNDSDMKNATNVAKKLRKIVSNNVFVFDDISMKVTSSLGVYCTENEEFDIEKIIAKVEEKLCQAKGNERNISYIENISIQQDIPLFSLNRKIEELRDTLNEICITTEKDNNRELRLNISEYLDELIVEYMKKKMSLQ